MKATLSNSELALMEELWRRDKVTAPELRDCLYPNSTKSQHGTIQKLLQRLEAKGFVKRDKSHSLHFFSPLISKEAYGAEQLESLADKLTSGSIAPLITHMIEERKISRSEIARLRRILALNKDEE